MIATPDIAGPPPDAIAMSALARKKGIAKQTLSERLAGYERRGLIRTWPGPNRAKLLLEDDWDRLTGSVADQAKLVGAATRKGEALPPAPAAGEAARADAPSGGYADEQKREKAAKADLAELDRDLKFGKALPIERVEAAAVRVGEDLARQIGQLPLEAEAVHAAGQKDGVHGTRVALKALAARWLQGVAENMARLAAAGLEEEAAAAGDSEDDA